MLHKITLITILSFSSAFISSDFSRADLPLTLEGLLTEDKKIRFEYGLSYANSDRNRVDTLFDLVQTGSGSFILLPVDVSNQRQNSDVLALTFGTRYGINAETELYGRLTATADDVRTQNATGSNSSSSQQWNELVFGLNHQFSIDNDTPALLGFVEVSAVENTAMDSTNFVYGKTGQIGFTIYRSIDPVVLSLTSGYLYAAGRDVKGQKVDPGDLLFVNPSLSFAISNEVTVVGGVQFKFRGKDEVAGSSGGIRTSQTDLNFGVGYAASENLTLNFNIRADISSDSGAQASVNFLYK